MAGFEGFTQVHRQKPSGAVVPRTLEELAALSDAELRALYGKASVPSNLKALDGNLRGRMLAVHNTKHGPVHRVLAVIASRRSFPWSGKTLSATSATSGTGINRIHLAGLGRQQLFPFTTSVDFSALDGAPCVHIDYENDNNPAYIRAIRDEVRQISPGLFFGPVLWKTRRGTKLMLWFGLEAVAAPTRATA
jgi:hypothetical protein